MKKLVHLLFLFSLILLSFQKPAHVTKLQGTFIQPWLYMRYTESQWHAEMKTLKEMGIEYLIMGDVANQNADDSWSVYYPSKLEYLKNYIVEDAVEILLQYCQKYDIKVYLGMGLDTAWESDLTKKENRELTRQYMERCNEITEELYTMYKSRYPETYYGFYFVTELFNTIYAETDEGINAYAEGLNEMFTIVIEKLNKLDKTMPLLFSPYVNIFGYSFTSINTDRFTEYWTEVLTRIPFRDGDMICPQDSNGAGGNDIIHLKEWTIAYRSAVNRANKKRGTKLLLGTNAELFISPDQERMSNPHGISYVGIHSVKHFADRLEICAPLVDALFCFAYPHHYSPFNDIPKYHQNFMKYLKTGLIEENKPAPPTKVEIKLIKVEEDGEELYLPQFTFTGFTDDTSVAQTNIYKNGFKYDFVVPGVKIGGNNNGNKVINVWVDWGFNFENETSTYEFECVDVNGNISPKSSIELDSEEFVDITEESEPIVKETGEEIEWKKTVFDYITYTEDGDFIRVKGKDDSATEIVLPDTIENKPVKVIDWYAFANYNKLKSITIPNSVTHISRFAFAYCSSLETVNMPEKLSNIEQYAFFGCSSLTGDMNFPNSLTLIEERAFCKSGLESVTFSFNVQSLGNYAFFDCGNLKKATFSNAGNTKIGNFSVGYIYDNGYRAKEEFIIERK